MTEENKKTYVGSLTRAWNERIKDIRATVIGIQKTDVELSPEGPAPGDAADTPHDSELFVGPVYEELTTQQVFAGEDDFYRILEDAQAGGKRRFLNAGPMSGHPTGYKRFSFIQKALATAIILTVAMLVYVLSRAPSPSVAGLPPEIAEEISPAVSQARVPGPPAGEFGRAVSSRVAETRLSWVIAFGSEPSTGTS